jgi:hypothetical protein
VPRSAMLHIEPLLALATADDLGDVAEGVL